MNDDQKNNKFDKIISSMPYVFGISGLVLITGFSIYSHIYEIDTKSIQEEIINIFAYSILFVAIASYVLGRSFINMIIELYLLWKKNFFAPNEDKSAFISLMMNRTKSFTYIFILSIVLETIYEIFIKG